MTKEAPQSDFPIHPHRFVPGLAAINGHLHAIDAGCDNWNTPLSSSELLADSMTYNLKGCIWALQHFCAFIRRGAQNQPPSAGQLKSIAWDQSFEAHSAIDYFLACGNHGARLRDYRVLSQHHG